MVLADLECEYLMGKLRDKEVAEKARDYLLKTEKDIDDKLKGKMFFKVGIWLKENLDDT